MDLVPSAWSALVLLVGAGVFVRFVPVSSMGWADEIIEFGFAWLVFFGAAPVSGATAPISGGPAGATAGRHAVSRSRWSWRSNSICLSFLLIVAYEGVVADARGRRHLSDPGVAQESLVRGHPHFSRHHDRIHDQRHLVAVHPWPSEGCRNRRRRSARPAQSSEPTAGQDRRFIPAGMT